ncbi:Alpha/Beta hydrolase protein [Hyaloraphidium curvatum]|nr:Alpha/Beta hydrolase protein [Hyaloraphidium curvatum]
MLFKAAAALVVLAVAWPRLFGAPSAPPEWHAGPRWEKFLALYEQQLAELFDARAECARRRVDTSFGAVAAFACGDPSRPHPALFLHGAGSNSMIYGDWILPKVVAGGRFAAAVDYPCDVGLSVPRGGDPKNCPASLDQLAQYVREIIAGLDLRAPVSLVGYSYGGFIAATAALELPPDVVDRVLLLAPAAVVSPLQTGWALRAMAYGLLWARGHWFTDYMARAANPDFDYERDLSQKHREFTDAINAVGATKLAVNIFAFSDDQLARLASPPRRTLVIVGANETVTSVEAAREAGRRVPGLEVEIVPRAGHLMLIEKPAREAVEERAVAFLLGKDGGSGS